MKVFSRKTSSIRAGVAEWLLSELHSILPAKNLSLRRALNVVRENSFRGHMGGGVGEKLR